MSRLTRSQMDCRLKGGDLAQEIAPSRKSEITELSGYFKNRSSKRKSGLRTVELIGKEINFLK